MKRKVGLFCGTFNPIHNGHLMMCNYILGHYGLDGIILVVSPDSHFKKHTHLAKFNTRISLCVSATIDNDRLIVSSIEDELPKPSYTYQTLEYFKNQYDNIEFVLIIGADNLVGLSEFKNVEYILSNFRIMVCPRNGIDCKMYVDELYRNYDDIDIKGIELIEGIPDVGLSSTFIRNEIANGKSIKYYVPENIETSVEIEYGP